MSKNLTRNEAWELLQKWNQEPFHLKHAVTVEGVMKYFAKDLGYADEADFWGIVGLLHDLDFEKFPEQHCIKKQEILREYGAEMLGWEPDDLISRTIPAMRSCESEYERV